MEARIVDFDGTLTNHSRTVLEQLALDYLKAYPNYKLKIRGLAVSCFIKLQRGFLNFKHSPYFTGETNSLNAFDVIFLRKAKIPVSFMREQAGEYAEYIPENVRKAIRRSKHDIYVISSNAVQLLEEILSKAEVLEHITEIRGNEFEIYNGVIEGFDRIKLMAGSRGKYFHTRDLPKKYQIIKTIGDDNSDIGLFKYFRKKAGSNVFPYALDTAPPVLKQLVGKDNVLESVADFL